VVVALSAQSAPIARRTLELAANLDADRSTRSAARLALGGAKLEVEPRGDEALLFSAVYAGQTMGGRRAVGVRTAAGLVLPAVVDPDGLVVMGGLPRGSGVTVAPGDERGKEPARGA